MPHYRSIRHRGEPGPTSKPIDRSLIESGLSYRELRIRSAAESGYLVQATVYDPASTGTLAHILTIARQPTVLPREKRGGEPRTRDVMAARHGVYIGVQPVTAIVVDRRVPVYYETQSVPHRPNAQEAELALNSLCGIANRLPVDFLPLTIDARAILTDIISAR